MIFLWPFFLYKKYGNKNYKLQDKTVIISNHYSTFDAFFIYLIYRKKKIYFATIEEVKKKFLSRFITSLFDCLYIDYDSTNLIFFKKCISILNNNGIICIFPEGEINPTKYGFFDFKASYIYLAKKTKANILPLYIYPELTAFKKSIVYIGDVIEYKDYSEYKDLESANMYVQSLIMDYSNYVKK